MHNMVAVNFTYMGNIFAILYKLLTSLTVQYVEVCENGTQHVY
jgi:hypothetical protein